jgi:hypothetical protein
MKSNQTKKSKEISLTVDGLWGLAKGTWSKVREHKLTIRVDPLQ